MAEAKTQLTTLSFEQWLEKIPEPACVQQCRELAQIMTELSGHLPQIWGSQIVGFGRYRYHYASGRSGDWPRLGFAPRKKEITLYLADEFPEREALLAQLGRLKMGKSCVYLKSLDKTDPALLRELIYAAWLEMARRYPESI